MDDLKDAIKALIDTSLYDDDDVYRLVTNKAFFNLKRQYALYFVEPEDDTDFKEWQNESETKDTNETNV